jgi:hypothetical protein
MAQFEKNFLKAKMNKDLDERLVPNGEYRHALNVEIATSEGSDVGSAQTIASNSRSGSFEFFARGVNPVEQPQTVGLYTDHENNFKKY